jgi:hypothetical protein
VLVGIVPLPKNAADQIGGAPPPQVVTLIKKPVGCKSLSGVESVSAAITFNSRHPRLADGPERYSGRVAFAPRGRGLRRSLSSARAQICSTHSPRIAGVALTRSRLRR